MGGMRRLILLPALLAVCSCGSSDNPGTWTGPSPDASPDAASDGPAMEAGAETSWKDVSAPDSAEASLAEDAKPAECGCLLGEGPYCADRAQAEAQKAGCTIPILAQHGGDLLKCENDVWGLLQDCTAACKFDGASEKLDDACELPVCDCFVQVAWCGSGAAKEAATMGCRIPLLPEHNGDILYCPNGQWGVKETCALGCVEAPKGTPDSCKSNSDYRAPYACNTTHTCSNGNHTSSHDGKDEYAYDFAMPVGTTIRAMRAGTVLRTRMVSHPGDGCYDGGGSSCANYANTVEVKHSDGTVALYMHLSSISVSKGDPVSQGAILGKSGNSGWSTGPHLHTQVQQDCGIWWCQSLPFKFVEDATVSAGTSVTSQNCP
jgi:hypothetical protein